MLSDVIVSVFLTVINIFLLDQMFLRTNITQNVPIVENIATPVVDRVVLIISDGLRFDRAFEGFWEYSPSDQMMPFLRRIHDNRSEAFFASSYTQAPTESRACHTAMLAGFWEDMANMKVFWKKNAYPFDHVLNHANRAWAIGGPDVVDFFSGPESVSIKSFPYEWYRFIGDPKDLDKWTVDQYKEIVLNNPESKEKQNLFVLHLAGVDTNGHRHGPHSSEYTENVKAVDSLLQEIETFTEYQFRDSRTAYIFTSDHGFSDAGVHGDGNPDTVKCPFLCWGNLPEDIFENVANKKSFESNSISQRSINCLISAFLGIPFATNNREILPTYFLGANNDWKSASFTANLRQLKTLQDVKLNVLKETSFAFKILSLFFELFDSVQLNLKLNSFLVDNVPIDAIEIGKKLQSNLENIDNWVGYWIFGLLFVITFLSTCGTKYHSQSFSLKILSGSLVGAIVGSLVAFRWETIFLAAVSVFFMLSYKLETGKFDIADVVRIAFTLVALHFGTFYPLLLVAALASLFVTSDSIIKSIVVLSTIVFSILSSPGKIADIFILILFASFLLNFYFKMNVQVTPLILVISMAGKVFFSGFLSPIFFGNLNLVLLISHACCLIFLKKSTKKNYPVYLLIFSLHILSVFSNNHHLICFLAISSLFQKATNLDIGYLPFSLKRDDKKIDISASTIALKLLTIVWASIYLPFGLDFADHLVSTERKAFYNFPAISFHVISMIVKSVVCVFLYVQNMGIFDCNEISNRKLYQKITVYCLVLSFLGLVTLSPTGSWLEIGINMAKYIIASTIGHAVYIIWVISCYITNKYPET